MGKERIEWIIHGTALNDPRRINSVQNLIACVNEIGFLPLFKNSIPGFSVEERTMSADWWSGNAADPWEWRQIAARSGEVVYGKFFNKKSGFLSLDWLPRFANWRRDGYDFDARWEDAKAGWRCKRIMDQYEGQPELPSFELKNRAGFGKNGESNFDGTVTELQMQTYLVIRDFRQKTNKAGLPYGWPIAVYATPETLWGYKHVTSAYSEAPETSKACVYQHIRSVFPDATESQIKSVLK